MSSIRTEPEPQPRGSLVALFEVPKESVFLPNPFINLEKNFASLGFFTPSHKKIRGAKQKTILFSRQVDGKRVEVRAAILPSAAHGLPITADQDKYFALQKIIADRRRQQGEVKNPVGFTTAELLRVLGPRVAAGKNYDDVVNWASRMTLTGICSEGVVYFAGRKSWANDTFHVFERFVSVGTRLPDSSLADQNYVWLSEWQLENLNHNYALPVDLETYKQLKNPIAKALVPLLQIWLYASRQGGASRRDTRTSARSSTSASTGTCPRSERSLGPPWMNSKDTTA